MNLPNPHGKHDPTTEERILAAAVREFGEKGFFGARTQAIAEEAGVNKALLHYYFRSKEKLYYRVIRAALEKVLTNVGRAGQAEGGIQERLERVVDAYLDTVGQQPGIMKTILRELVDGGSGIRNSFLENGAEGVAIHGQRPTQLLDFLGRRLNLDEVEVMHLFINIVGMCVISFLCPPILESAADIRIMDFESFLKQRRKAIKAMVLAYAREHIDGADENKS